MHQYTPEPVKVDIKRSQIKKCSNDKIQFTFFLFSIGP